MARHSAGMNVRLSSATDEQLARVVAYVVPWLLVFVGMPAIATAFWGLNKANGFPVVSWILMGSLPLLAVWLWRLTSSRSRIGRGHHMINLLGSLGWIIWVSLEGWSALALGVLAGVGSVGALMWMIRYRIAPPAEEAILDLGTKAPKRKRIDVAYVARAASAGRPGVRRQAERIGRVIPAVRSPWQELPGGHATPQALPAGSGANTVIEPTAVIAPGQQPRNPKEDQQVAAITKKFAGAFRRYTTFEDNKKLSGIGFRPLEQTPWRIRALFILVPGVHEPEDLIAHRGKIASLCQAGKSRVLMRPNPTNNAQVYIDLILKDMLAKPTVWAPPPESEWHTLSVGDEPVNVGVYEDGAPLLMQQAPIYKGEDLVSNAQHTALEGKTGAGKSGAVRIVVADDIIRRYDVEDWAIDTSKGVQTMGPVAVGLDWFALKKEEARAMIAFVVRDVVPARASYLAKKGLDGWQKDCGLPLLRIPIEELGVVAMELDDLSNALNTTRSAGIVFKMSNQRWHHGVIDTNSRAAIGAVINLGVENLGDAFLLPDYLKEAGADTSLWGNREPGKMLYTGQPNLTLERELMAARTHLVRPTLMREAVLAAFEAKHRILRERFPDWYELLEEIDTRGVYAKRTTGLAAMAKLQPEVYGEYHDRLYGAETNAFKPTQKSARPAAAPDTTVEDDDDVIEPKVIHMAREGRTFTPTAPQPGAGLDDVMDDDYIDPVTVVTEGINDPSLTEHLSPEDQANLRETLDEIGDGLPGPDSPIDLPDLDTILDRSDDDAGPPPTAEAQRALRLWLAGQTQQNANWTFTPSEVYRALNPRIGRGPSWYRGELRAMAGVGWIEYISEVEGRYVVTRPLLEKVASEYAPAGG